jgi:hypothetical protein
MHSKLLAVAALCSACGAVSSLPADSRVADGAADGPTDGPVVQTPTMFHGAVAQTMPPVRFGSGAPLPACTYTATLKQLDIQIGILPSGAVTSGQVQNLYVEGVVAACQSLPNDTTVMNYTLMSAMAGSTGTMLTFRERAGDKPGASLLVALSAAGTGYQAELTYHRTDLLPPFDWTVVTTATLTPR